MRVLFTIITLLFTISQALAQGGEVRGRVFNPVNNEGIPFANVIVLDTDYGTVSDEDGNYVLSDLPPGLYNIRASFIGFRAKTFFEIQVTLARSKVRF